MNSDETELVGWARRPSLRAQPQSPKQARQVLAAALGVPQHALSGMTELEVRRALGRMRHLVTQVDHLATTVDIDELTGALRRGTGVAALQREIDRARRAGSRVACVFIDVDGLKQVNDTGGHGAGDKLLVEVVAAVRERLRSYDLVVRYGGDEFFCILTSMGPVEAEHFIADIERNVQQRIGRTISSGVAFLEESDTADTLVARADADLYAKRNLVRSKVRRE